MIIIFVNESSYAIWKNIAEYRSKYYALKAKITEQRITIEDALKFQILNNLWPSFRTYLTIVNDCIGRDAKLDDDETIFKAIQEEKTWMKANQKAFANIAVI